jgi:hypothetical protein
MTYKEYITAVLGKFGLSESDIDFILVESDLNGATTVTSENKKEVKLAIYKYLPLMISGLSEVSEGDYTVKWNISGLRAWLSILASELGLDDPFALKPTCRDASNKW